MRFVSVLVVVLCMSCVANAQTGALGFAQQLHSSGRFHHDRSFGGPEVIYWSSGGATPQAAHAAWMRSPGHRSLVASGQITDVQCYGGVCVGRGSSAAGNCPGGICSGNSQPIRKAIGFPLRIFRR